MTRHAGLGVLLLDELSSLTGQLALGVVVLAARDPHCVRESEH
jgi:hypothetical protein